MHHGLTHERGHRGAKDEWLTPPSVLAALGPFDLDPCSPVTPPWPIAARTYHERGIEQPWTGRVFCNPPYGPETGKWLAKCAEHGNAVALVFARTETGAWHEHVWPKASAILFLRGRLSFCHVDGTRGGTAGAPSALIAFGGGQAEMLERCGLPGYFVRLRP